MPPLSKYAYIVLLISWQMSSAQPAPVSIYVFLSPECPLCQNYTRTLNQLEQQYAGKITMVGIVPGKTWKKSDLTAFTIKYHLAFPLQLDSDLKLAHSMHATTTPEAILLGSDHTVIYQGAIDNWYKALGRAANKPTQNYLQDAIDYTLRHQPPPVKKTEPIGCLINDF
jgi:thiol-disulfide isomerase/thioredoxin